MAEVRWTLTASADLQSIETFIAVDSTLHAVQFIDLAKREPWDFQ